MLKSSTCQDIKSETKSVQERNKNHLKCNLYHFRKSVFNIKTNICAVQRGLIISIICSVQRIMMSDGWESCSFQQIHSFIASFQMNFKMRSCVAYFEVLKNSFINKVYSFFQIKLQIFFLVCYFSFTHFRYFLHKIILDKNTFS